jgi:hypothetical protein
MPEDSPLVTAKKDIFQKATLLSIDRRWPSMGKSVDKAILNTKADLGWMSAQKYLYKCNELKRLSNWDQTISQFLEYRCLPFPLKRGIHLLPKLLYAEVEAALVNHKEGMDKLVEAFINRFDEIVQESKAFLKDQFNPADYPSKEVVRDKFQFTWRYLKFGPDDTIQQMDRDRLARESALYQADIQEGSEAIRLILRKSFQDIVTHLFDVLTPEPGGRRKTIKKGGLDPLTEFIRLFNPRDLTEDEELRKLVEQAKQLAAGISPEAIRSNESIGQRLQEGFGMLKQQVDKIVSDAPIRKIKFG